MNPKQPKGEELLESQLPSPTQSTSKEEHISDVSDDTDEASLRSCGQYVLQKVIMVLQRYYFNNEMIKGNMLNQAVG